MFSFTVFPDKTDSISINQEQVSFAKLFPFYTLDPSEAEETMVHRQNWQKGARI